MDHHNQDEVEEVDILKSDTVNASKLSTVRACDGWAGAWAGQAGLRVLALCLSVIMGT